MTLASSPGVRSKQTAKNLDKRPFLKYVMDIQNVHDDAVVQWMEGRAAHGLGLHSLRG